MKKNVKICKMSQRRLCQIGEQTAEDEDENDEYYFRASEARIKCNNTSCYTCNVAWQPRRAQMGGPQLSTIARNRPAQFCQRGCTCCAQTIARNKERDSLRQQQSTNKDTPSTNLWHQP